MVSTDPKTEHQHGFWREGIFYPVPLQLDEFPLAKRQNALSVIFGLGTWEGKLQRLTKCLMEIKSNRVNWPLQHRTNELEFKDYTLLFHNHLDLSKQQLLFNPYPVMAGFSGPSDRLTNISLIGFIKAESNRIKYLDTLDVSYLDSLIAVLWRPKKSLALRLSEQQGLSKGDVGDRRVPYSDIGIAERAEKIGKAAFHQRAAAWTFYQHARAAIFKKHGSLFPTSGTEGSRPYSVRLWLDELNAIAADKGKSPDEVAHWRLLTVLQIMKQKYERR